MAPRQCLPRYSLQGDLPTHPPLPGVPMRAAALLITTALIGCQTAPEPSTSTASVRDSAGVEIVTSTTPTWQEGEGWQVDTMPMTVIGADESDPQQQWKYVEGAARLSDGSIAVAADGSIRLFGADGRFVRLISRTGEGPGEFRYLGDLLALPGDTIRANNSFGYQVAWYTPSGRLIREERLDREQLARFGPWSECSNGFLPDGSRYGCKKDPSIPLSATNRPSVIDASGMSSPGPGLLRQLNRVWLVTPARDTAYPLGIEAGLEQFGVTLEAGREAFVMHPFHSRSYFASGGTPQRLAIATNPEYRIELWSMTGKLERIIERPGARQTPPPEEIARANEYMASQLDYMDKATRDRVLAQVPTPDSLAAVSGLAMMPTGELLVQREGRLLSQPATVWDVFGTDGGLLGNIRIPGHMRLLAAGSDHLLVMRRTPDDAWLVEAYRLKR